MLDATIRKQLQDHFAGLQHDIELVASASAHPGQDDLVTMLRDVADTGARLSFRQDVSQAEIPTFAVHRDGKPTGISFRGIPGGHEFSSLILAILNAGGVGRLPDAGVSARIRALNGGHTLSTYISLTCTNCPDVVQAMNQIALVHGDLRHVTVDGGLVQSEVDALGIQGVPSLMNGENLVHSGRATLIDLLEKLEASLGTRQESAGDPAGTAPRDLGHFDVVVLGGGPAGVSAAIYSVRKGLRTALVAERLGGQLQETKGIENFVSVLYTEGAQLAANLAEHLRSYPVEVLENRRINTVTLNGQRKPLVNLSSGESLQTDSVIVATGARWRELNIPGEKEYIGRGVAFCPHCDGPYYKGRNVAVVGGGNSGVEAAIDLAGICKEVTLFEFADQLKADDVLVRKLRALPNVTIHLSARTSSIEGDGSKVTGLTWEDRSTGTVNRLELDGVFVQIGLSPNSTSVKDLVETTRHGEIVVDGHGRTSVPGVYAAGDVTTAPYKQIVIAMGDGAKVALAAFEDRMRS